MLPYLPKYFNKILYPVKEGYSKVLISTTSKQEKGKNKTSSSSLLYEIFFKLQFERVFLSIFSFFIYSISYKIFSVLLSPSLFNKNC